MIRAFLIFVLLFNSAGVDWCWFSENKTMAGLMFLNGILLVVTTLRHQNTRPEQDYTFQQWAGASTLTVIGFAGGHLLASIDMYLANLFNFNFLAKGLLFGVLIGGLHGLFTLYILELRRPKIKHKSHAIN